MVQGHIPKRVIYVAGASKRVQIWWDDNHATAIVDEEVRPCFAVDKDSPKSLATARSWAKVRRGKGAVLEEERENSPFDIRICGLEVRERGGRAYKVVTDGGFWFDLREDVLLDAILCRGIAKGGKINAKFVWGQVGSQMKLVRVDSALHQALLQGGERKTAAKIKPADLVAGGVYGNVKGERFLVLRWVSTTEFTHINASPAKGGPVKKAAVPESVVRSEHQNKLLLLEVPDWAVREDTPAGWLGKVLSLKEWHYLHYLRLQDSLSVIEHSASVELPADILTRVRRTAVKSILAK